MRFIYKGGKCMKQWKIHKCEKCGWVAVKNNFGPNLANFIGECARCGNRDLKIYDSDVKEESK
jgi:hypothetical protein